MKALLTHFIKDESGAHIVEVALVFSVVMMLIMGGVEFGLIMYTSSLLDTLTAQAARYAKTGYDYGGGGAQTFNPDSNEGFTPGGSDDHYNVSQSGNKVTMRSREAFIRNYIRQTGSALLDPAKIKVSTSLYDEIQSAGIGGEEATPYNFGDSKEAIVLQVRYEWSILTPIMLFVGDDNGVFPIQSTLVVQNENY